MNHPEDPVPDLARFRSYLHLLARLHLGAGEPSSKVFADIPVRLQLTYHRGFTHSIGFALLVGAQTGSYPYYFIDAGKLGWAQLGINITGLASLFAAAMAIAIWWDRRRSPKG